MKRQLADALHPLSVKAACSYHLAKRKAEKLAAVTHQRTYVLCDDDGKLVVTDKSTFFLMCRKHKIPRKITLKNLHINSVYYTGGTYYKGITLYHHKPMPQAMQKRKLLHYKRFLRSM